MIPLPGLDVMLWMVRITVGLTVATAMLVGLLAVFARQRWQKHDAASWEHRMALASVVWSGLWFILNLPGKSALPAVLPLAISGYGFRYIAAGNRKRSLENPAWPLPAAAALLLAAILLVAVGGVLRARAAAKAAAEAELRAEGQRNQDYFAAVVVEDADDILTVGTTSTPPNDEDDVWLHAFSLGAGPAGKRRSNRRWDENGSVNVIRPLGEREFLVGGRRSRKAWLAVFGESAQEKWSELVDVGNEYSAVSAVAIVGDRFVAAGFDSLFSRGAFMLGATLEGDVEWVKPFRTEEGGTCRIAYVEPGPENDVVALGARGEPGRIADLWLLRVSLDGVIIDETTFGQPQDDSPGGLAVSEEGIFIAAHQLLGVDNRLWLRKMAPTGEVRWDSIFPAAEFGRASDLALLANDDIVVVGSRRANHKSNAWVARFDGSGKPIWQRTLPPR